MTIERDHHGFDAPAPLGHPARASLPDGHSTGPEIGERLPNFRFPDSAGQLVDYHESRGRYQACDDQVCFLPTTEELAFQVDLDVIDVPALGINIGHGQREDGYRAAPHMARLMFRNSRKHPSGWPRLILKTIRLEIAAKWRSLKS